MSKCKYCSVTIPWKTITHGFVYKLTTDPKDKIFT